MRVVSFVQVYVHFTKEDIFDPKNCNMQLYKYIFILYQPQQEKCNSLCPSEDIYST